MKYMFRSSNLW